MAQVNSGKVYRIVNSKYGTVVTASPIEHKLRCVEKGAADDYQQMWEFTYDADKDKYSIQNVYSRRYVQNQEKTYALFETGNEKVWFNVKENASAKGNYNLYVNRAASSLHCASNAEVVPWSCTNSPEVSASEWVFEEVDITAAQKDQAYENYVAYSDVFANKATIIEKVNALFEDKAGTKLKADYASKSDAEILAALDGVPADLQQAILKIKNNTWKEESRANLSEKNFRIYDYKPYSNPEKWKDVLYHRPFNRINNPTGICSESDKGFVYVWVENIPEGAFVDLAEMNATGYFGPNTHWDDSTEQQRDVELVEGLNIVPTALKNGVLYVRYVVDTDINGKKLADYPTVKVHIEGGYVNGFWSKERGHTNEDWVYMGKNMFRNEAAVQAVGDHSVLNFRKKEFLMPFQYVDAWGFRVEGCAEDIETVMKYWDFWNERQRWYMGLDKYYDWFNNKQLAMSDDGGFMDAGNYRTHYNNNTLTTIVNLDRISRDGGSAWGPLHEIGHTNQYAFEIVGTSEVSNNALANFTIFDTGTHTSRGWNMDEQIVDFVEKVPYVVRGEGEYGSELFSMTRMYFQLFLYFHAAGKKPDFYPVLFEELRKDKLVGWSTGSDRNLTKNEHGYILGSMDAKDDQLKFVEKCCSIGKIDLTEFFEAWGFFIPMKNAFVGDYGHHHVYLTQGAIDSCKARIKAANYPKKGGHLMFLEDRIRPSKKKKSILNDDETGYRLDYSDEAPVANNFCGLFGQWEDYIDESVKAQGYYYMISNGVVTIVEGEDAAGALGFKLYDADTNELITYTNRLSMKIPYEFLDRNYKVAAAQADGENYYLKNVSEGPESMQLTALEKSLEVAGKYKTYKTYETSVGYFYPQAVKDLEDLYKEAKAAYDNKDTSKYSYAEWSILLDNECKRLLETEGTRLLLEEGMEVNIYTTTEKYLTSEGGILLGYSKTGLKDEPESRWSIEYAGETGVYYLKNADGCYIKDFEGDNVIYADAKNVASAARFTIDYSEVPYTRFLKAGDEAGDALGVTEKGIWDDKLWQTKNYIKGISFTDENTKWRVKVLEDKSAEFYKQELESAMTEARMVIAEVLNLDSIGTMNIFNNGVVVKDRNLETYIVDLYNQYVKAAVNIEDATKHKAYLTTFRELLGKIDGTYFVTLPVATKGETTAWYRLVDKESGSYLSVADEKRLASSEDLNNAVLWAFVPTGVVNEYKAYNYEYKGYISQNDGDGSKLYVLPESAKPLTFVYNSENKAIVLKSANEYLRARSSGYVDLGKESQATYWTLEFIELDTDVDLSNIEDILEEANSSEGCYDLSGRKVIKPTTGIYIQNGKKVYVK